MAKSRTAKTSQTSAASAAWLHPFMQAKIDNASLRVSGSPSRQYQKTMSNAVLDIDIIGDDTITLGAGRGSDIRQNARRRLVTPLKPSVQEENFRRSTDVVARHATLLPVQQAFLTRATRGIEDLLRTLAPESITHAVSASTDAGVLLAALGRKEILGVLTQDPLAEAKLVGQRRLMELLQAEGGPLGSEEVAEQLQISRQAVVKRRNAGTLLGLEIGTRLLYPSWQIDGSRTLQGLEVVLKALRQHDEWRKLSFFVNQNIRLEGRSPLTVLRAGDLTSVIQAAETLLEHGAA